MSPPCNFIQMQSRILLSSDYCFLAEQIQHLQQFFLSLLNQLHTWLLKPSNSFPSSSFSYDNKLSKTIDIEMESHSLLISRNATKPFLISQYGKQLPTFIEYYTLNILIVAQICLRALHVKINKNSTKTSNLVLSHLNQSTLHIKVSF